MRAKIVIGLLVFSSFCLSFGIEEEGKDENSFEFDLNNSYRIENTKEEFQTPNGFGIPNPDPFGIMKSI